MAEHPIPLVSLAAHTAEGPTIGAPAAGTSSAARPLEALPQAETSPDDPPTAGLLMIGNELLSGQVEDANSPFLCRELRKLGVDTRRVSVVPDESSAIGREVRALAESFSWVFTSGGIGPTHDDITIEAVAEAFGIELIVHAEIEAALRAHYAARLTTDHLRMAKVPQGAEILPIEGHHFPQVRFRNIFIFPGIPELLRYRFGVLRERFRAQPVYMHEIYLRADEGIVAACLRKTEAEAQGVLIGSYPSFGNHAHTLKLSLEGRDATHVRATQKILLERLRSLPVHIVRTV